ncbi:MAG: hypothetical protein RL367_2023, partial [Pseudomonadota bacterium]
MAETWREIPVGESFEAEQKGFDALAKDIMRAQVKARKAAKAAHFDRAFHAKALLAVKDAELAFIADLADDLRVGFAQPKARYPLVVRISNAANRPGPDFAPDLRGIAIRIDAGESQ